MLEGIEEAYQNLKDYKIKYDVKIMNSMVNTVDEYKAYVEETGNYFPRTDCIHNGNKVGSWFLGQRKERKRGRLNPEFEKILLEYYPDFFKERKLPSKKKKDDILVPN